jgi:hypothetical protein
MKPVRELWDWPLNYLGSMFVATLGHSSLGRVNLSGLSRFTSSDTLEVSAGLLWDCFRVSSRDSVRALIVLVYNMYHKMLYKPDKSVA